MIKLISNKLLNFINKSISFSEEMKEIYRYGIEITISSIWNFVLILTASLLLGDFISGIVFQLFFIALRMYCGGYRQASYLRCSITSVITYVLTFLLGTALSPVFKDCTYVAEVILLSAFIPILIFSPVKNKNKKLSDSAAKKCRTISILLYIILALVSIIFCYIEMYGSIMVITLVSVSVMILIEVFMQRRSFHKA